MLVVSFSAQADDSVTVVIPDDDDRLALVTYPFTDANGQLVDINVAVGTSLAHQTLMFTWDSEELVYTSYFFDANGPFWRETWDGPPATIQLAPGQGFWLRNPIGNPPQTLVFTGTAITADTYAVEVKVPHAGGSLALLGFPYPAAVDFNEMGFTNMVNVGPFGDLLYRYDPNHEDDYEPYFYDAIGDFGGGWRLLEDPEADGPHILNAGEGFWYGTKHGNGFIWQAIRP